MKLFKKFSKAKFFTCLNDISAVFCCVFSTIIAACITTVCVIGCILFFYVFGYILIIL